MKAPAKIPLWITFDIEEDHHCNFASLKGNPPARGGSITADLERIAAVLAKNGAKATLFVVGEIVEKYRAELDALRRDGCEIGCHSLSHRFVADMAPAEFREDTRAAKQRIEDALGVRVVGYRAPSWSVREGMPWFYDELEAAGFEYSSSVFPVRNPMYGVSGAPLRPYQGVGTGGASRVMEIPVPVEQFFGKRIPFAGGFYHRALPGGVARYLHRRFAARFAASMFYLHPGELGTERSFLPPGKLDRFIHGYGVRSSGGKVERLLAAATSLTSKEYLEFLAAGPARAMTTARGR